MSEVVVLTSLPSVFPKKGADICLGKDSATYWLKILAPYLEKKVRDV